MMLAAGGIASAFGHKFGHVGRVLPATAGG